MSDKYSIDSHKLVYHPHRVAQWLEAREDWEKAKHVYPIYVEVSPFGACNHRCLFCAVDYIGYMSRSLDPEVLDQRIREMAELGVKSIMFAGEGEPTLWKHLPETLDYCTSVGIDTSLTTNMVPFNKNNVDSFIRNCSWIKTSINGGTPVVYSQIHRTKESDFTKVMDNFAMSVKVREENGYACTIGAQMLLLPENSDTATELAKRLKDIGVDYLVIKPYSQHKKSETRLYENIDYKSLMGLEDELSSFNSDRFNVIFRARTMNKLTDSQRGYDTCYSTPFFWSYIMSDGCVYGCSAYLDDDRFNYGNIHEAGFKEIWEGPKRKKSFQYMQTELDIDKCRENCRMDDINRYLWELTHPKDHVNFI